MSGETVLEDWVIAACQQLGIPVETRDDDFFEAGATSLTVMRLVSRAEKEFGTDALSPEEIIEHSAVHAIAAVIDSNTRSGTAAVSED